jgi:hypothetical protein
MYYIGLLLAAVFASSSLAGTVSFSAANYTAYQENGSVTIQVVYAGTPTPLGTDDVKVRYVDGNATAGYNYGTWGSISERDFRSYDFDVSQKTLDIVIPIQLFRWGTATYFFVELEGINGSETGPVSSARITIAPWTAPQAIRDEINWLESKIKKARFIKNAHRKKKALRRLYTQLYAIYDSIAPYSEQ